MDNETDEKDMVKLLDIAGQSLAAFTFNFS
jgi:hypothetical protein